MTTTYQYTDNKYYKKSEGSITIYKMAFTLSQCYTTVSLCDEEGCILIDGYVDNGGCFCLIKISERFYYFKDEVVKKIVKALKLRN